MTRDYMNSLHSIELNRRLTPIRRANLRLITQSRGTTPRLAGLMGITTGPITVAKRKTDDSIGAKFCRRIESALSLPEGWLDKPRRDEDVPDAVKAVLSTKAGLMNGVKKDEIAQFCNGVITMDMGTEAAILEYIRSLSASKRAMFIKRCSSIVSGVAATFVK